ncbi:MAG: serine hydrolase domain-containing protein [Chloroflexota bacterium]
MRGLNKNEEAGLLMKLREIQSKEEFPSLAAIAVQEDEMVWSGNVGYACLDPKEKASAFTTIYHLGSVTKLFTAVALIKLRDAGNLDLSDTLQKYLPQLTDLKKQAITLRQLVTHSSGLPLMPDNEKLNQMMQEFPPTLESLANAKFPTIDEVLAGLDDDVLVGEPGDQVSYSNLGFALLGHVIELVGKRPYATFIKEEILRPLKMAGTGFWEQLANTDYQEFLATCYLPFFDEPTVAPPAMKDAGAFVPAASLWASPFAMGQFIKLFTGASSDLLSKDSIDEMLTLDISTEAARYADSEENSGIGLGWFVSELSGHRVVEHGGADPSTAVHLAIIPEQKCGVFVATNSGQNPAAVAEASYAILSLLLNTTSQSPRG